MKKLITFSVFTFVFFAQFSWANSQIVAACTETVQNYAIYRDALDANGYASSFSADGTFVTPGKIFKGRDELRGYIENQPGEVHSLHHITTKQISATSDTDASGVIYVQVNFYKILNGMGSTYREAQAIYEDQYKLNKGVCEITHRSLNILTDTLLSQ